MRLFDFHDERHPKGRVGLQTFGSSVRFKNIKVTSPEGKVLWEGPPAVASPKPTEAPRTADVSKQAVDNRESWVPLFDGVTLSGWTTAEGSAGEWKVEDGSITCSGRASHLFSPRGDYKDFQLPRRDQDQRPRQLRNVFSHEERRRLPARL